MGDELDQAPGAPPTCGVESTSPGGLPAHTPLLLFDEVSHEKAGDVLGPYELVGLLGEGSMGRVFSARHQTLGRDVAIKVLRLEHALNPELVGRFFREAQTVSHLRHPNIVEVYDLVGEALAVGSSRAYCVMERLSGEPLSELIARRTLPLRRAAKVATQVCAALEAAHAVGVIHRDIKPDNVFVADGDRVKVLDFGAAKLTQPLGAQAVSATAHGLLIGTPAYMSPEQAQGRQIDARSDVYALGVLLFEMLCGHPPFEAPSVVELLIQIARTPAPALPSRGLCGEPIPAGLRRLVARCLQKDPARRPGHVRAVAEALEAALSLAPRPRGLPRGTAALAIAATVALVAGGAVSAALRSSAAAGPAPQLAEVSLAPQPQGGGVAPAVAKGGESAVAGQVQPAHRAPGVGRARSAVRPVKARNASRAGARNLDALADPYSD